VLPAGSCLAALLALDAPGAGASPAAAKPARPHVVYAELLGKGGLFGLGYERRLGRWLAAGAAISAYALEGQRIASASPYLAGHPLERGRHGLFLHAGPQLVRVSTPSPVPEWDGQASTRLGLQLSAGYEHRRERALFRAFALATLDGARLVPWIGLLAGWRL
jgi:hypothetical protein